MVPRLIQRMIRCEVCVCRNGYIEIAVWINDTNPLLIDAINDLLADEEILQLHRIVKWLKSLQEHYMSYETTE